MLWSYEKCQKIGVGRGLAKLGLKNTSSDKNRTKYLEQNGVTQCFSTAIGKV